DYYCQVWDFISDYPVF
nr:immunoglobulin light chain junction region [Macaca mulatta]